MTETRPSFHESLGLSLVTQRSTSYVLLHSFVYRVHGYSHLTWGAEAIRGRSATYGLSAWSSGPKVVDLDGPKGPGRGCYQTLKSFALQGLTVLPSTSSHPLACCFGTSWILQTTRQVSLMLLPFKWTLDHPSLRHPLLVYHLRDCLSLFWKETVHASVCSRSFKIRFSHLMISCLQSTGTPWKSFFCDTTLSLLWILRDVVVRKSSIYNSIFNRTNHQIVKGQRQETTRNKNPMLSNRLPLFLHRWCLGRCFGSWEGGWRGRRLCPWGRGSGRWGVRHSAEHEGWEMLLNPQQRSCSNMLYVEHHWTPPRNWKVEMKRMKESTEIL